MQAPSRTTCSEFLPGFKEKLNSDSFLVTAEVTPPKGVNIGPALSILDSLASVDAVNVTDQNASVMRLGPLPLGKVILDRGIEPICQFTCRDRNRIALQSDLLGAHVLGIRNILCLTGDPTGTGDHPDAKPVFDLSVIDLIRAASGMESGNDLAGNELNGVPSFCLGAAANPGAADVDIEVSRMGQKVEAGVRFFQTQAVYDSDQFARFMAKAHPLDVPILAGILVLHSGRMARYLNANVPGIAVPQSLIDEMDAAENKREKGIEIASRIIAEVASLTRGVHIMPMGWERDVPRLMQLSGIKRTDASPGSLGPE